MPTLILRDVPSYGIGDHTFRRNVPREVTDARLYSKLIEIDQFEELPPLSTFHVVSARGREIYLDGGCHVFPAGKVTRVTRRVFSRLPPGFHVLSLVEALTRHREEHPGRPFSVLLMRDMGAGDVLIMTDVVQAMKRAFPEAALHFATQEPHRCLLRGNPHLDGVHVYGDVDPRDFDYDANLARKSETMPDAASVVRVEMYARAIGLVIPPDAHETKLVLTPEELMAANALLEQNGFPPAHEKYRIALQAAGSGEHRSLSPAVRLGVARKARDAGCAVVVFGHDPAHFPGEEPGVWNACGKLADLRQVAAVIACCHLLIGPDSSGYHLASALDPPVPALVVFTTVDPKLRVRDYPTVTPMWVGPEQLTCQPCHDFPCGGLACVRRIDADLVWKRAERILTTLPMI